MSQTPPAAATIEGQMYLFRKAELVTRDAHGSMGISKPERPLAFCEQARAVPLTLSELPTAMRFYPIIFTSTDNPVPLAVMGLIDDVNLFVGEDGQWAEGHYVPGYLRRYPFALASDRDSDPSDPRMAIIVDAEYEGLTSSPEIPFFKEDGSPSDAMMQAMDFCKSYETDRLQTARFAETLKGFDILAQQAAQYTPEGQETQAFARYVGVDEKKLQELPDDKFLELRRANVLPLLYAQLMSMANWRTVLDRRARRFNLTGDDVLKPLKTN